MTQQIVSDNTIVDAIKSLIEANSDLYNSDITNTTKANHVYDDPLRTEQTGAFNGYVEIIPPEEGTIEVDEDDEQSGGAETTVRDYKIIFTFKSAISTKTTLLAVPSNFRAAIIGAPTLSTTGVKEAKVISWGYNINVDQGKIVDQAIMDLRIITDEIY